MIIKYWLKIVLCPENRHIKTIYNMMLNDMESMPHKENWAKLSFSYLVFTPGGSFSLAQNTLSAKAQKAIFRLNSYLY